MAHEEETENSSSRGSQSVAMMLIFPGTHSRSLILCNFAGIKCAAIINASREVNLHFQYLIYYISEKLTSTSQIN